MDINSFQVIVIKDTYEIFDSVPEVQRVLSSTWGMKLRGYKSFYNESSICPNDKLDYYSSHILISQKSDPLKVLTAIKTITYKNCEYAKCSFPIFDHLFGSDIKIDHYLHAYALNTWVEKIKEEGVAYSNGFSIDPDLPKSLRKFLFGFITYSFESFYSDNKIPNIVHGVNTLCKIDQTFEDVGFKDLYIKDTLLVPTFKMASLSDLDVRIMISENYGIDCSSLDHYQAYKNMWANRKEFTSNVDVRSIKSA